MSKTSKSSGNSSTRSRAPASSTSTARAPQPAAPSTTNGKLHVPAWVYRGGKDRV